MQHEIPRDIALVHESLHRNNVIKTFAILITYCKQKETNDLECGKWTLEFNSASLFALFEIQLF